MLDTDTKRRIDTARDILVGKVPDPKSQVEQITIALIYKFMDDMDAEAEEFGGKRKFFSGDFARYGWAKLMRSGLGGHETLNVYAEAISKMPENPGIPPLFREIFKNAFLPYRDPETLRAFLKIIDEFEYDHSERLGDAFEYLLSVLGSQGDAGQFRTPRDIIDFIVSIIDPKKNETVLDPACGTAGFLISSFKHILNANKDPNGHSTLTPDDRERLALNFKGYDISPDMVRLSLVNMYLHGFTNPHIVEYDTLTNEDRWNEYADVILANPPFMSPKGGIKPHNRFSVQSKRSEVLFVDYMAEHLTPSGRAGIIVPEGIIFQTGAAYRQLRDMLINEFLIGVISLPSGVFMPYTGVKTSVLVLDRAKARARTDILFSEVRHIGVSLGVKRTPTEQNDLPSVLRDYRAFHEGGNLSRCSWIASRKDILANECNLIGHLYRPQVANGERRRVRITEVCRITRGTSSSTATAPGPYPLIVTAAERRTSASYQFEGSAVCVPLISSLGHGKAALHRIHFATGRFALANLLVALEPKDSAELDPKFLYHVLDLKRAELAALMRGAANVSMKPDDVANFQIPLPPLPEQREITAEIEGYERVIEGARTIVESYKPQISIRSEWPLVEIGELCTIKSGGTPDRSNKSFWNGSIPWVTTTLIDYGEITSANEFITEDGLNNSSAWIVPKGTLLMAMYGQGVTRGRVAMLGINAAINQACAAFVVRSDKLIPGYLFWILRVRYSDLRKISEARGGNQSNLNAQMLKEYRIPLPPVETQQAIVDELESEEALVRGNRELITRFERKIEAASARAWGEDNV